MQAYTDYLFLLAIYNESVPLDKLLLLIAPGGPTPDSRAEARKILATMKRVGLVHIDRPNDGFYIRLTPLGRTVSEGAAEIISSTLVYSWQAQQSDPLALAAV